MKIKIIFLSEPAITPYKDYSYLTFDSFIVSVNDDYITVPRGFETDLASIPRLLWSIFPPQFTEFVVPAILHDYMYTIQYKNDRKLADDVLYEALLLKGVSKVTAYMFWTAVRLFGKSHYE